MAEIQIKTKFRLRSDTDQNFQTQNPSLLPKEIVFVEDLGDFKVNNTNSNQNYTSLNYLLSGKYLSLGGGTITGPLSFNSGHDLTVLKGETDHFSVSLQNRLILKDTDYYQNGDLITFVVDNPDPYITFSEKLSLECDGPVYFGSQSYDNKI